MKTEYLTFKHTEKLIRKLKKRDAQMNRFGENMVVKESSE